MWERAGSAVATTAAFAVMLGFATPALAHAADRGHVLLLPTGYYLAGGAAAVAVSFIVLAVIDPRPLDRLLAARVGSYAVPMWLRPAASAICALFLLCLLIAGWFGSRDPLSNPLPLFVWTVFWVGMTLLQGIVGDVWRFLDPIFSLSGLVRRAARLPVDGLVALPQRLGYLPATVQFFAFGWFELVYVAPDDPARLATVVAVYVSVNTAAACLFGYKEWSRRGECFAVFFGMIARMGVVARIGPDAGGRERLTLCPPGAQLVNAAPLPMSGALFLLLTLSTVSFDGLMRTFFWLGRIGVNPLEFEGRSSVTVANSIGLLGAFLYLSAVFVLCVQVGQWLTGKAGDLRAATGALVWSIVPIALAYHFSHYLTSFVLNAQYALSAISDPLANGWNLFGTAGMHVSAGVTAGADMAWRVWNAQFAAIVIGHVLAVVAAHVIAFRLHGEREQAAASQAPLAVLMVLYTLLGLWLLSSPTGA